MIAALIVVASALAAEPSVEVWAGHAIVSGKRSVPILGKVEAKTESWVLARVTRKKDGFELEQRSCEVRLSNPLGVKLALNAGAAELLPPLFIEYVRKPDGRYYQAPSTTGWDKEDVDRDKSPGMTVNIDASICDGKLFVGIKTKSMSRGVLKNDSVLRGEIKAQIAQHVLGHEGACIGLLADDANEAAVGSFAYVPTSTSATCASLAIDRWPIRASAPR